MVIKINVRNNMKTLLKIGLATVSVIAAFKLGKGIGCNLGVEMMYKYKKNPDSLSEKDRHWCKKLYLIY